MIANAKKRTKASDPHQDVEIRNARLGGDRLTGNDLSHAVHNTLADGNVRDSDSPTVGHETPLGGISFDSETNCAKQAAGVGAHDADKSCAGRKNKRRSTINPSTKTGANGGGSSDEKGVDTVPTGVAATRKRKRRSNETVQPSPTETGSGSGGEDFTGTDEVSAPTARDSQGDGSGTTPNAVATGNGDRESVCKALQELQRRKAATLKSRIMIDNQLAALVSTELGYHAGLEEADRKELRKQAEAIIKAIYAGDELPSGDNAGASRVTSIVQSTSLARDGFDRFLAGIEKEMVKLAKQLPVAEWCQLPDQRGFGLLSLATVIGETGDLSLYANPAKVWKRLGLAPYQGKMPSTWRRSGGLSAEQWTELGYSPRRRSIMYVVGENIVKQNKSIYRQRYDETKASAAANHPDWNKQRCHYHGMLLSVKRLIRDLWKVWHAA